MVPVWRSQWKIRVDRTIPYVKNRRRRIVFSAAFFGLRVRPFIRKKGGGADLHFRKPHMKIVAALDSFKGSLSSLELADAVEKGVRKVFPDAEIFKVPVADGGEGTTEALCNELRKIPVHDPLGNPIEAVYGILPDGTAVIETAAASGLLLIPPGRRNPLIASTFGTGEMIRHAFTSGCRSFILGLGGSATNDGGMGLLSALGFEFIDGTGKRLSGTGGDLLNVREIATEKATAKLSDCRFLAACDVKNPLYGPNGAAFIFAPQKGADTKMVGLLDDGLRNYAAVAGKRFARTPGAGAAGGLGFALLTFLKAELRPGIELILEKQNFDALLEGADFVITGEGRIDSQTTQGKTPIGVAAAAKRRNIPVIALAGWLSEDAGIVHDYGIDAIFSIQNRPVSLAEAMDKANAARLTELRTEEIFRTLRLGHRE